MLIEQAKQSPVPSNVTQRALGVKRASLKDSEDYDAKLEAMSACQTLELGMN